MLPITGGFTTAGVGGGFGEARARGGAAELWAVGENVLVHETAQVVLVERRELYVGEVHRLRRCGFRLYTI